MTSRFTSVFDPWTFFLYANYVIHLFSFIARWYVKWVANGLFARLFSFHCRCKYGGITLSGSIGCILEGANIFLLSLFS